MECKHAKNIFQIQRKTCAYILNKKEHEKQDNPNAASSFCWVSYLFLCQHKPGNRKNVILGCFINNNNLLIMVIIDVFVREKTKNKVKCLTLMWHFKNFEKARENKFEKEFVRMISKYLRSWIFWNLSKWRTPNPLKLSPNIDCKKGLL